MNNSKSEANLIEDIVDNISRRLINLLPSVIGDQLVGIEPRVEEIYKLLELELDDRVTFVGICGMGGIGKTTIARLVYERLSNKYEGSCFLANVREIFSEKRGVVHLQQMLLTKILKVTNLNICDGYEGISLIRRRLCKKKVFLVLDDVDQLEQLEQLAGINDWFGSGSRIVITTRDEHVLVSHGIKNLYSVQGFNYYEAQSLFRLKAFKNIQQTTDYVELLEDTVRYANGLPLALEVLGSLLCDRSVNQWKSALK
ncbi:hypothetical protein LWI29_029363 [Acer saccharum]|uniref:AAA+ ATPase domain-containing protein n=1 Tax=Acer saccharum TaxID=4024 RepID=A0AA39S045_ACESA|nr:hypothetical protein LWI29_029363 [Acer saccharum]